MTASGSESSSSEPQSPKELFEQLHNTFDNRLQLVNSDGEQRNKAESIKYNLIELLTTETSIFSNANKVQSNVIVYEILQLARIYPLIENMKIVNLLEGIANRIGREQTVKIVSCEWSNLSVANPEQGNVVNHLDQTVADRLLLHYQYYTWKAVWDSLGPKKRLTYILKYRTEKWLVAFSTLCGSMHFLRSAGESQAYSFETDVNQTRFDIAVVGPAWILTAVSWLFVLIFLVLLLIEACGLVACACCCCFQLCTSTKKGCKRKENGEQQNGEQQNGEQQNREQQNEEQQNGEKQNGDQEIGQQHYVLLGDNA